MNILEENYLEELKDEYHRRHKFYDYIRNKYRKILCRWCRRNIRQYKSFCSMECENKMKKADARYRLKNGIKLRKKTLDLLSE